MATNLRLGRPVIPHAATSVDLQLDVGLTYTGGAASGYPVENLFGGNRADTFRMTNPYSNLLLAFTLPSALTADFLYLANTDVLKAGGATRLILAHHTSASYASSTREFDLNPLSGETLYGPESKDLIYTFTETVSRQYWWVNTLGASTCLYPMTKLFFGKSFDMGRDPDADGGLVIRRDRPTALRKRAAYSFDVTWSGVSYTKAVSFYQDFVLKRRFQPVVLYTLSYHEVLNNHRAVLCRLLDSTMPPIVTDTNKITATFEEVL